MELTEDGILHFQGYSEFKAPIGGKTLINLGCGVHIEPRKGTREQARDYVLGECEKVKYYPEGIEDPIVEFGEWIPEGTKGQSGWRIVEDILEDKEYDGDCPSVWQRICTEQPTVAARYHRGIKAVIEGQQWKKKEAVITLLKDFKHMNKLLDKGYLHCVWRNNKMYGLIAGAKRIVLDEEDEMDDFLKKRLISGRPTAVPVPGGDGERLWCPEYIAYWGLKDEPTPSLEKILVEEQVARGNTKESSTSPPKIPRKSRKPKVTEEDE